MIEYDIVNELLGVAAEKDDATSNRLKALCTASATEITRLRKELIIAQCTRDEARRTIDHFDGELTKALDGKNALREEMYKLQATIDQLRAVAGAVSIESGLTFGQIKVGTKGDQTFVQTVPPNCHTA